MNSKLHVKIFLTFVFGSFISEIFVFNSGAEDLAASATNYTAINYTAMLNQCQSADDPGCCGDSVRIMRDKKFIPATSEKCPYGFRFGKLSCSGGLSWCEPQIAADIAVNGGEIGDFKKRPDENTKERNDIRNEPPQLLKK